MSLLGSLFVIVMCVILPIPVILILTYKEYAKNIKNADIFEEFLNAKAKSGYLHKRLIEGSYKGRRVWLKIYRLIRGAPTTPSGLLFGPLCTVHLCIEPEYQKGKTYGSDWWVPRAPVRQINEYTSLYTDGRVYYTYVDFQPQKGLVLFLPHLDPQRDRKSLWAILSLRLQREDVQFYLDELAKTAEIIEKGHYERGDSHLKRDRHDLL